MRLGRTQRRILLCLKCHGSWPGGWVWGNRSVTERLLQALEAKGLVERATWAKREVYQLSAAGKREAALS